MKTLYLLIILIATCSLTAQTIPSLYDQKIILRVNGHDHPLPGDIINEFDKTWKKYKSTFEQNMIGKGNSDAKVIGGHLNNSIDKITFSKGVDDKHVNIKMSITNNPLRIEIRYVNFSWWTWRKLYSTFFQGKRALQNIIRKLKGKLLACGGKLQNPGGKMNNIFCSPDLLKLGDYNSKT